MLKYLIKPSYLRVYLSPVMSSWLIQTGKMSTLQVPSINAFHQEPDSTPSLLQCLPSGMMVLVKSGWEGILGGLKGPLLLWGALPKWLEYFTQRWLYMFLCCWRRFAILLFPLLFLLVPFYSVVLFAKLEGTELFWSQAGPINQ